MAKAGRKYYMQATCPDCGRERRVQLQGGKAGYSHRCRKCQGKAQAAMYAAARGGLAAGFELRPCLDCGESWPVRRDSKAKRCKSCAMKETTNRPEQRAARSERFSGAGSSFWRGGVTPENKKARTEARYRDWRRAVFLRDDYTCQHCGARGGKLHADHIQPFATVPELRFDLSNGRALCVPCHQQTDTYGHRSNPAARARRKD